MGDSINYRPRSQEVSKAEFMVLKAELDAVKAELELIKATIEAPKRGRPAKEEKE